MWNRVHPHEMRRSISQQDHWKRELRIWRFVQIYRRQSTRSSWKLHRRPGWSMDGLVPCLFGIGIGADLLDASTRYLKIVREADMGSQERFTVN